MDEWSKRYRRDYESLPPLKSFPESKRKAEAERRESIRKALYALPDAPKPSELSDLEKNVQTAKADLIASWINGAWCREDQTLFHTWWRVHDFAGEYRPEFKNDELKRKSANLEILLKTQRNSGDFQSGGVSPKDKVVVKPKDCLSLAREWTVKPRRFAGPTLDQRKFVEMIIDAGGWSPHANLSGGHFDWENPRKSACGIAKRINEKIKKTERWEIIPEDNNGCRIVPRRGAKKRSK